MSLLKMFIRLAGVLTLAASLAACGGSSSKDSDPDNGAGDTPAPGDEEELSLALDHYSWGNNGSPATVAYDSGSDALILTPDFSQSQCPREDDAEASCAYAANYSLDGPLDLRGAILAFRLDFDDSLLENDGQPGGIVLQAYAQQRGGDWDGVWTCDLKGQDFPASAFTYRCVLPDDNDALIFPAGGDTGQIGLQLLRGDQQNPEGGVADGVSGSVSVGGVSIENHNSVQDDAGQDAGGDNNFEDITIEDTYINMEVTGDETATFSSDARISMQGTPTHGYSLYLSRGPNVVNNDFYFAFYIKYSELSSFPLSTGTYGLSTDDDHQADDGRFAVQFVNHLTGTSFGHEIDGTMTITHSTDDHLAGHFSYTATSHTRGEDEVTVTGDFLAVKL